MPGTIISPAIASMATDAAINKGGWYFMRVFLVYEVFKGFGSLSIPELARLMAGLVQGIL